MDGFEVLQRLRDQPRTANLPVIVITGREDVIAIDRAFDAGANCSCILSIQLVTAQLSDPLRLPGLEDRTHPVARPPRRARRL